MSGYKRCCGGEIVHRVGNELRGCGRCMAQIGEPVLASGTAGPVLRNQAAGDCRRKRVQHRDLRRVERHDGSRTGISREHLRDPRDETAVALVKTLELQHERGTPGDEIAELADRQHPVGRRAKRDALELCCRERGEPFGSLG